ncbi:MAG: DUF2569 domain-containing protein [Actinomycetota bacterium]|nr:DUF2569 domain-containing protein [Actinomycetota bacterium]
MTQHQDGQAEARERGEVVLPPALRPLTEAARNAYETWVAAREDDSFFSVDGLDVAELGLRKALEELIDEATAVGVDPLGMSAAARRAFPEAVGIIERIVAQPERTAWPDAEVNADPRLVGIGGWLVLPAIGLVLGPIVNLVMLMSGGGSVPQLALRGGWLLLAVFAAFRFFGKRTDAPLFMIAMYVAGFLIGLMPTAEQAAEVRAFTLVQGFIGNGIWIAYFAVSRRVKVTFVN